MSTDWISRADALNLRVRNFVDGRWRPESGAGSLDRYSPRDGRLMYSLGAGEAQDADDAVRSAKNAFEDGRWSKLPVRQRKKTLQRLASLIESHREELALLECLDVGKPITDALTIDIPFAAASIRYAAEAVDKLHGDVYAVDAMSLAYQLYRPRGVVAAIIGWNFPLVLAATKIGPALATGNTLVLKPSELTSLSASRVAELAVEAGVPEGVFNVVHGNAAIGASLAHHSDVDLLTFTGSSATGKKLLIAAGQSNMKALLLECGGKAPNVVFDDCPDLDAVADAVLARAFWNQGQVCTASSRLLIQKTIHDELLRILVLKVEALVPGDPLRPETRFGAVVSTEHKTKITAYVESGEREGARIAFKGRSSAPFEKGCYVAPIIFSSVSPMQKVAQEEIFGPVLSVIPFSDEKEAVRIANSTVYALSAILWTRDLGRAHRVAQAIEAGSVVVNATSTPSGGPARGILPVGGHKQSGIGVEGGFDGLKAYMTQSAVQLFV